MQNGSGAEVFILLDKVISPLMPYLYILLFLIIVYKIAMYIQGLKEFEKEFEKEFNEKYRKEIQNYLCKNCNTKMELLDKFCMECGTQNKHDIRIDDHRVLRSNDFEGIIIEK